MNITKERIFIIINIFIYILSPLWAYGRSGGIDGANYFFYVLGFLLAGILAYRWAGKIRLSWPLLIAAQIGLSMHFIGGMKWDGTRIYNLEFGWLRYDKIVHLANGGVGFLLWQHLLDRAQINLGRFSAVILVLIVLGCGAVIEIIEYIGLQFVNSLAIQDLYDNNMQDLAANLLGCILVACFLRIKTIKTGN